jgi:UDP-2,4-diacetamido-2,4,6-trideoxy-beta-L-altropyranose hydrolase
MSDLIGERGFVVTPLPVRSAVGRDPRSWLGASVAEDAEETLASLAPHGPVDWLVVDHYGIDARWHHRVRRAAERVLVIDDLADRHLDADLVLDQNVGADTRSYDAVLQRSAVKLLGPRYALVAPAFREARTRKAAADPRDVEEIAAVIALGGTDPDDATSTVLELLLADLRSLRRVDVVIGRAHPNAARVRRICSDLGHATVHVQTTQMPMLLEHAHVAVGAGGSSTWERLCVGVPTLTLPLADNQLPTLAALVRAGLVTTPEGSWEQGDALARTFRRLLHDHDARSELRRRGQALIDGDGAARVVQAMVRLAGAPATSAEPA